MRPVIRHFKDLNGYDSIWQYLWLHETFDKFWKVYYSIRSFFNMLKRMAYWGWVMRKNYDWDFTYFYQMMYYKLDRMDKEMIGKGNLQWQYEDNKRIVRYLKAAKEAARRLGFEDMEHRFSSEFYDNYGFQDLGSFSRFFKDRKPKYIVSTEMHTRLRKASYKQDKEYHQYHKDLLYNSLNKFGDSWWD